jgi:3-deoxy-D-manno-octulosonic-acid transferase
MYTVYSLFLGLALIAFLPYFAYQAFVNKKYFSNLRERLGKLPPGLAGLADHPAPAIWVHAVSVGETLAAKPLVTALHKRLPQFRVVVSTTTMTGQAVARSRITGASGFCYFPLDWRFSVRRALNTIRPEAVVLMESELWPNFLNECHARHIPVIVANGRISDRSFVRWSRFGILARRMFQQVSCFAMQTSADAERAVKLGAIAGNVFVSGNIKYDCGDDILAPEVAATAQSIEEALSLDQPPLIVAGSTCDGEEEILLEALENIRKIEGLERVRMLLAPRHPERFDSVVRLLEASRLSYKRRSDAVLQTEVAAEVAGATAARSPRSKTVAGRPHGEPQPDVILLDSIGELAGLYRFASVVFVGGSLIAKGGHNLLEPATFAKAIVVGPHMENFREITDEFIRRDAIVQLHGTTERELVGELRDTLSLLLTDDQRRQRLGENALAAVTENRGATLRTSDAIEKLIS